MSILKTGLKVLGSAALGTAGVASTILRKCACASGNDELANIMGNIQDKSFNTIQDMWTPEEKRTDAYYENQLYRSEERAEYAMRDGEKLRSDYEKMKENNQ